MIVVSMIMIIIVIVIIVISIILITLVRWRGDCPCLACSGSAYEVTCRLSVAVLCKQPNP